MTEKLSHVERIIAADFIGSDLMQKYLADASKHLSTALSDDTLSTATRHQIRFAEADIAQSIGVMKAMGIWNAKEMSK